VVRLQALQHRRAHRILGTVAVAEVLGLDALLGQVVLLAGRREQSQQGQQGQPRRQNGPCRSVCQDPHHPDHRLVVYQACDQAAQIAELCPEKTIFRLAARPTSTEG
jgi:hypothetical protein